MFLHLCYGDYYVIFWATELLFEWEKTMFGLKNVLIWGGICVSAMLLNACASAVFPDFDEDEDDVVIAEGGRVERELPKEGNSLKADNENAAYEDDEEPVEETEKVSAAKTKPVVAEDMKTETGSDKIDIPAKPQETQTAAAEQPDVPSVSYRMETIYFANGSAAVDARYNKALRDVVRAAKKNDATIIVYGYASSRTRNTDPASHKLANFKVSLERAQNVAAALKRVGMPASRIVVEALSDTAPAYQEVMPEGERLNRRAEIYISY